MSDIKGRFIWYETHTTDIDGAIAFYTKVAGWGTQRWEGMGEPYHMWANGDRTIGGIMKLPPNGEAPPNWMGYIGTPDVDATTARAEALGAKIWIKPMDIPTVGRFSVIQDPQGVLFAAYTPANPMPPVPKGVGDIDWHEIATTDLDAAFAFYADLFGWQKMEAHDMGPMGIYQEYGLGGEAMGGMYVKPADMPAPPHFVYYIRVADLDAAVSATRANGGTIIMGPHDVPGGDRIAMGLDPQGAAFALHWKNA
jgi:uncharacterized protein